MRPQLYRSNLIACAEAEMGSMCTMPRLFASLLLISLFCFFLSRLSVRNAPDRSVTSPSVSASASAEAAAAAAVGQRQRLGSAIAAQPVRVSTGSPPIFGLDVHAD